MMPGKTRPSLLDKVLYNLQFSNLSKTDKDCIRAVFKRYKEMLQKMDGKEKTNE